MHPYRIQAKIFKALAHPARLRIMNALREEGQYVCHLVILLGRSQPNISQHLAVLRAAGLVVDEREGSNILYRLNNGRLLRLLDLLAQGRVETPPAPERKVGQTCPCPRCCGRREQERTARRRSETKGGNY
ncbi:MAG: metalloregulator ArsR/SmtB family transcription factor [Anaerolineae bacterium]